MGAGCVQTSDKSESVPETLRTDSGQRIHLQATNSS